MLSDKYWKKRVVIIHDPAYIEAENRRLRKQATCTHDITTTFKKFNKFSTRCEICHSILISDATITDEIKSSEQFI